MTVYIKSDEYGLAVAERLLLRRKRSLWP